MRNLGDLNDLYKVQDVILLTEIIESRFQAMIISIVLIRFQNFCDHSFFRFLIIHLIIDYSLK